MVDGWDLARRKYDQIAPDTSAPMTRAQSEQMIQWLKSDVYHLTSSVLNHPGFRRRALWPLEKLSRGSASEERIMVMNVERSLVQFAQSLLKFAERNEIRELLHRLGEHLEELETPTTPIGLSQVRFLSTSPWRDLVSVADYFGSAAQFNYHKGGTEQWAEFLPFFNARIHSPGDFISRCLMLRIESWESALRQFWIRSDTARQKANLNRDDEWERLKKTHEQLSRQMTELTHVCSQGTECRLRESCIALVQLYAAVQPEADLKWLGDAANYSRNASLFLFQVSSQRQWDVPERIAGALLDVVELIRKPQDPQDVISEKVASHRLVLMENSSEGFFDSRSISNEQVNWHAHDGLWEFLWQLANRAKTRRHVDRFCLSNLKHPTSKEPPSLQAIRDRRSQLSKLIVPELDQLILDEKHGCYRLNLEPHEICRLGYNVEETLAELPPETPRLDRSTTFVNPDLPDEDSSQSSLS